MTASLLCLCLQLTLLLSLQQHRNVLARSIGLGETLHSKSSNSSQLKCDNNTVSVHELPSVQDVTVDQINYHNNNNDLAVGKMWRYVNARALLKFADLPKSCKLVVNAEMHLYYSNRTYLWRRYPYPDHVKSVQVRQVVRTWTEEEALAAISSNNIQWRDGFLAADTNTAKTRVEASFNITEKLTPHGYVSFDLTNLAQRWLTGQENYGVLLSLADERIQAQRLLFYSRESGVEVQPYLRVKCWSEFCASSSQKIGSEFQDDRQLADGDNSTKSGRREGSKTMSAEGTTYDVPADSYTRKN